MPAAYIPLLLLCLVVLSFPIVALTGSLGGPTKFQPSESGDQPESALCGRRSERFYILAVLLMLFEVGTIFLFLWAVLFRGWLAAHLAAFALFSLFVFLGILCVGYVWLYKKAALDVS